MKLFRIRSKTQVNVVIPLGLFACLMLVGIEQAQAGSPGLAFRPGQLKSAVKDSVYDKLEGIYDDYMISYQDDDRACSNTTRAAFKACKSEISDDYWEMVANCQNESNENFKEECLDTAEDNAEETMTLCRDQREARSIVCDRLGEEPYDPRINHENFVDFEAVIDGEEDFEPNTYFPLIPGTTYHYVGKNEMGVKIEIGKVEVKEETIEILGINCIVVRDRVWEVDEEGERYLIEDTDDWFAQDKDGNVWYMGEEVKDYEDGVLVSIDGSFQAGRDYDKAGFIMLGNPQPGDYYRQEFSLGNAEDVSETIEFLDSLKVRGVTYYNVLKTAETIPLEPDVLDYKYFAPGVGNIYAENLEGEILELKKVVFPE